MNFQSFEFLNFQIYQSFKYNVNPWDVGYLNFGILENLSLEFLPFIVDDLQDRQCLVDPVSSPSHIFSFYFISLSTLHFLFKAMPFSRLQNICKFTWNVVSKFYTRGR